MGWVTALRGAIVGLDTAPLIYYVEENPTFLATIDPFFVALDHSEFRVVTSIVSLAEALVHPFRSGDATLADHYRELLLNTEGITTYAFTHPIAEQVAQLRGTYRIRTPDAIQIATARHYGATFFVTNDHRLRSIPGLTIIVLNDVVNQESASELDHNS